MPRLITLPILLAFLFITTPNYAAQSTADVVASPELKQNARNEILKTRSVSTPIRHEDEYVIGHGDVLSVSIFGEGDMAAVSLSGSDRLREARDTNREGAVGVIVMMDGRISLKHIGDVEVVGMTLTEFADYLKKLYATINDDPIVTTTLVQGNSQRYTVMGTVANPGVFFLDYPLTLIQAVARSGGFTEWSNQKITIVRERVKAEDKRLFKGNTLEFDYDDFISGEELVKNVLIRSGDIIITH